MKKVIHEKLYDTETARRIFSHAHTEDLGFFSDYQETLYRKPDGEYFLHGRGGSRSKYAGDHLIEGETGEQIVPLTSDEVREWAEVNMSADQYMDAFGPVSKWGGGGVQQVELSVVLDADTAASIYSAAQREGISVSELIASKF